MTNAIPLEPFVIVTVEDEKNNDNNSVTDEYTEYSATNENVKLLHKNADNTLSLSDNSKSNKMALAISTKGKPRTAMKILTVLVNLSHKMKIRKITLI